MKRLTILLVLLSSALAFGQNKELTADESKNNGFSEFLA